MGCITLSAVKEPIYTFELLCILSKSLITNKGSECKNSLKQGIMAGCIKNCKEVCGSGVLCMLSAYLMCMVCCPCYYFCLLVKCCHHGPWLGGEIDDETHICFENEDCCTLCGFLPCTESRSTYDWRSSYGEDEDCCALCGCLALCTDKNADTEEIETRV